MCYIICLENLKHYCKVFNKTINSLNIMQILKLSTIKHYSTIVMYTVIIPFHNICDNKVYNLLQTIQ